MAGLNVFSWGGWDYQVIYLMLEHLHVLLSKLRTIFVNNYLWVPLFIILLLHSLTKIYLTRVKIINFLRQMELKVWVCVFIIIDFFLKRTFFRPYQIIVLTTSASVHIRVKTVFIYDWWLLLFTMLMLMVYSLKLVCIWLGMRWNLAQNEQLKEFE